MEIDLDAPSMFMALGATACMFIYCTHWSDIRSMDLEEKKLEMKLKEMELHIKMYEAGYAAPDS